MESVFQKISQSEVADASSLKFIFVDWPDKNGSVNNMWVLYLPKVIHKT